MCYCAGQWRSVNIEGQKRVGVERKGGFDGLGHSEIPDSASRNDLSEELSARVEGTVQQVRWSASCSVELYGMICTLVVHTNPPPSVSLTCSYTRVRDIRVLESLEHEAIDGWGGLSCVSREDRSPMEERNLRSLPGRSTARLWGV
jgi:hypothetical protein